MASYITGLPPVDYTRLSLSVCVVLMNRLWLMVALPPNSADEGRPRGNVKDQLHYLAMSTSTAGHVYWAVWMSAAIVQAILIYSYPSPPKAICPQPSFATLSNPSLFTWNPTLAAILIIVAVASAIRIAAFRNLGADFTFGLKRPSGLVKTGIHRYVQHPSYTGLLPIWCCVFFLYVRFDGLLACYLPESWVVRGVTHLHPLGAAGFVIMLSMGTWARVADEERMLREAFGKEWEDYHRRTKRFIPGIF